MQCFHTELTALLSQLDLPVYLSGQIPGNAVFPYITYTTGGAAFGNNLPVTVSAWFLGRRANADRIALCDAARALFPSDGVKLPLDGGLAMLHPSAGEFISLVTDETEPRLLGARIRLTAALYDL